MLEKLSILQTDDRRDYVSTKFSSLRTFSPLQKVKSMLHGCSKNVQAQYSIIIYSSHRTTIYTVNDIYSGNSFTFLHFAVAVVIFQLFVKDSTAIVIRR